MTFRESLGVCILSVVCNNPNEPVEVAEPLIFPVVISPAAVIVPLVVSLALFLRKASSTFNVSPSTFGIYLNKIGCFCFEKQTLQPREKKEFVLTFFLDPKVVDDNKTKNMSDVTLSFTFFSSGYYEKSNT